MKHEFHLELGGRTLTIETGALAKQANGSVLMRYGDTVGIGNSNHGKGAPGGDRLLPLLVDSRRANVCCRQGARGLGTARGSGSGEAAILATRMIDRPLRPRCSPRAGGQ